MLRGFKSNGSGGSNMASIRDTVARIKRDRISLRTDFQVAMDELEDVASSLEELGQECETLMDRDMTDAEETLVENEMGVVEDFLDRVDDIRSTMKAALSWIKRA